MNKIGLNLEQAVTYASRLTHVPQKDLEFGDSVFIATQNSTYFVIVLEDGFYLVSGGWFDLHGFSPMKTTIAGCSWGGSIIKIDVVAVCGLCLEFDNRLVTTPIKTIDVIKSGSMN